MDRNSVISLFTVLGIVAAFGVTQILAPSELATT